MNKKFLLLSLLLLVFQFSMAQTKKNMTVEDLASWQRITEQAISDNGKWVACKMEPWEGNATVYAYNAKGKKLATFPTAKQFQFSATSNYLIVGLTSAQEVSDSLKLKKTKKDQMPMDQVVIYALSGKKELLDSIKSYKIAPKADWIAYQQGRKDSSLHVRALDGSKTFAFRNIKTYQFSKEGSSLYFVSARNKKKDNDSLFIFNTNDEQPRLIKEGNGEFMQPTFNKDGSKLAFLYDEEDTKLVHKKTSLWLFDKQGQAQEIVVRTHPSVPTNWVISEYGKLKFSEDNSHLFFGTAPQPLEKDSTQLAEKRPNVQVWSWNEPVQYTVQDYNKKKDAQKSFQAVYSIATGKVVQLADEELPNITLGSKGNASVALLSTSKPYSLSSMWEGRTQNDYYTVSLDDGKRTLLSKADYTRYRLSPESNYAYGYAETDSCWYAWSIKENRRYRLTSPDNFTAWDEKNDVPDYPEAYGEAGWSAGDKHLYLYDRYDIWEIAPDGKTSPMNLTKNGRSLKLSYQVINLDRTKDYERGEARVIDQNETQLLSAFNEKTMGYAYYSTNLSKPVDPVFLIGGDYMLRHIIKANDTKDVIYTKESFEKYPDIYYSDLSFKKSIQLTKGYQQQDKFLWGTAELISWTTLDGKQTQGVIYKPANFNSNKKYPMIVNFYEKNSTTLHNFRMPEPNRSTVDYHFYNSHEYIIFNPDVYYRDGYPGESCYNCVMPGIAVVASKGYIDETHIGAQGHSWGGYQVAYLATRTNRFAAIEAGAPVVNMFSAYGGIRWGSGMARAFQYEHTQSRVAGTPWDEPLRYFTNSPLFTMNKVNTPILIMHNDKDGHVPWYQGIEYFVAMKRLGKPCWLLNYTGEPHWPMKMPNKKDFQTRMSQFFDHFLKDRPMPKWMQEGVPAVKQPYELGY